MLNYHTNIREIIRSTNDKFSPVPVFEPTGGDGTAVIYHCRREGEKRAAATRAVETAVAIARAIADGELEPTHAGIFSGRMLEAVLDGHPLRFSLAFSAAKRLENLCEYFAVPFLMGEEAASLQERRPDNVVAVGRVMPRHFDYPINIYTIYEPGLSPVPADADPQLLQRFIRRKNIAAATLIGNSERNIAPDFPAAKLHLLAAQELFLQIGGQEDTATGRLLEYIEKNPLPSADFNQHGMRILESRRLASRQQKSEERR